MDTHYQTEPHILAGTAIPTVARRNMSLPGESGQNLVEWRFRKEQTRGKVIVFGRKLRVSFTLLFRVSFICKTCCSLTYCILTVTLTWSVGLQQNNVNASLDASMINSGVACEIWAYLISIKCSKIVPASKFPIPYTASILLQNLPMRFTIDVMNLTWVVTFLNSNFGFNRFWANASVSQFNEALEGAVHLLSLTAKERQSH